MSRGGLTHLHSEDAVIRRFRATQVPLTIASVGAVVLLLISGTAVGQGKSQTTSTEIEHPWDTGTVSGNVYTNHALGLIYEFPKEWAVDHAAMDYENARPRVPEPSDPKLREIVRVESDSHLLLEVASHASDSPSHAGPPSIRFEADRLSSSKPVTATDMLAFIRKSQGSSSHVIREPEDHTFDGRFSLAWTLPRLCRRPLTSSARNVRVTSSASEKVIC